MTRFKTMLAAAALAVPAIAMTTPAQALTTFFTDFEVPAYTGTSWGFVPSVQGWTASVNQIEVQFNNVAGFAYSGTQFVELDSDANSAMSRLIDAGTYTLSFWYSARPGVAASSNGIEVLLDGVALGSVITANGGPQTSWSQFSYNFSTANQKTLTFRSVGTSDGLGGYLDDIRLSGAVPEPATWAMMIAGFGMIGSTMRNRRRTLSIA